jgi:hypothetical protein
MRVFDNKVIRRIPGPKRDRWSGEYLVQRGIEYLVQRGMKWQKGGENCMRWSSIICILHQILLGESKEGGWDCRGM